MSDTVTIIEDNDNVARAVFFPQMISSEGVLSRAIFSLRHNESYISVCQMSIESWLDDIRKIPVNDDRQLNGYAVLNVGDIRTEKISPPALRSMGLFTWTTQPPNSYPSGVQAAGSA